jgi:hypothetical protein
MGYGFVIAAAGTKGNGNNKQGRKERFHDYSFGFNFWFWRFPGTDALKLIVMPVNAKRFFFNAADIKLAIKQACCRLRIVIQLL